MHKDPQSAGYKGGKYVDSEAGYSIFLISGLSNSRLLIQ